MVKLMIMFQKILVYYVGKEYVELGDLIFVNVDFVLGNDVIIFVVIKEFEKIGIDRVFDKDKIVIVFDYFILNKDIKFVQQCKMV